MKITGGYDPTNTEPNSLPVLVETAIYKRNRIDPIIWPRNAGYWPGYVFTGEPLKLPAIQFGFGAWQWSSRAGRVLSDRIEESKHSRHRRRCCADTSSFYTNSHRRADPMPNLRFLVLFRIAAAPRAP